jgi:inhibitor of KinA
MTIEYSISTINERSVALTLGSSVDEETRQRVWAIYHYLIKNWQPGWTDVIPAYTTICINFDPVLVRGKQPRISQTVKHTISYLLESFSVEPNQSFRNLKVPVCYHPSLGIDLKELAKKSGLSIESIVDYHCSNTYTIYMLGFLPGFAYMGSVDSRIIFPRLKQPRLLVKAGSVGIAGKQTGIYPFDSPGGWNILGRTPLQLFDKHSTNPVLFNPSDRIRFYPISLEEFQLFESKSFNPFA